MTSIAPPLLAALLSPALFFGGASVVAAPILIHLLARRRFKRIRWAAMEFLVDAQRRNRRRIQMEEWILLALRCLAVLLLALMIARPFIKPTSAAAFLGGSQRVERVIVIDDSFSMAYLAPGGTPFSQAKVAVRRLIESVRRESPDDTVTLLRMSAPDTPLETGTYLDDSQTEALFSRLEAMVPSQRPIDPSLVVKGVVEVLERSPDVTSAAVYFISDFQRHNWADNPEPRALARADAAARQGMLDPLAAWASEDRGLHVVLINVGEDEASNLAATGLTLSGGQIVAGATGTLRAEVRNFGSRSLENIELEVSVGDLGQPSSTVRELPSQQSVSVDLRVEFFRAGFEAVRLELPEDSLPLDDVRYLAADVASAIRVLVVDGEASADDYDDEVTYLTTALRPEGEVFSGNEAVVVDETKLEDTNLSKFHLVVLANVYRLSEPAVEALELFVRRGGGLLIFLGDQVDVDFYNGAFYREGEGLLPAELTEIIRAPDAARLIISDRLHPTMRGLSRDGDPLGIGQIPFFEYYGTVAAEPAEEPGDLPIEDEEVETDPLMGASKRPAKVIARFDDADGSPAIVERGFGAGRVVLVTTSADKEWHAWPDHPTFLPIMMELVRHCARRSTTGGETWVGDVIEWPLDPGEFEADAIVRTPSFPKQREVGVTATTAEDGKGLVLRWEHTEEAGIYHFLLKRRDGGESTRMVAVNVDPAESDLTMAEEPELRRAMGDVPFEYIKGVDQLAGGTGEARTELWRFVLFAVVLVLMLEQVLAFVWGRRR